MKRLILCDVDGVLANNEQRAHLLPAQNDCNTTDKWEAFNQACDQDEPLYSGFHLLDSLITDGECYFSLWSGRSESVKTKSESWFRLHLRELMPSQISYVRPSYFRAQEDHRPAAICKMDLVAQAFDDYEWTPFDELILIDDDLSVLQECKARFPYAICVWMGGLHCKALANGVTTK